MECEPKFRYVLRTIQSPPCQFFDTAHPVDERLFVDVEASGSTLPGAVLRQKCLQRRGKLRVVGSVVVEERSKNVLDDAT